MFARIVTMRLRQNAVAEFSQTIERKILPILRRQQGFRDEITFMNPNGMDAVGISLWDTKEQAEAYNNTGYPQVQNELNSVIDGTPRVQTYEVANSTVHKIAARAA